MKGCNVGSWSGTGQFPTDATASLAARYSSNQQGGIDEGHKMDARRVSCDSALGVPRLGTGARSPTVISWKWDDDFNPSDARGWPLLRDRAVLLRDLTGRILIQGSRFLSAAARELRTPCGRIVFCESPLNGEYSRRDQPGRRRVARLRPYRSNRPEGGPTSTNDAQATGAASERISASFACCRARGAGSAFASISS